MHALLDDVKNLVLRVSAARSFRAPGIPLRELRIGVGGLFNLITNPGELNHETIYSLGAGYVGHWTEHPMVRVDDYYQ